MVKIRTRSWNDSTSTGTSNSTISNKQQSNNNKCVHFIFSMRTLFWFLVFSICLWVAVTIVQVQVRQRQVLQQPQSSTSIIEKKQRIQQDQSQSVSDSKVSIGQQHQQQTQTQTVEQQSLATTIQEHDNESDTERQTTSTEHIINDPFTKIDNDNNHENVLSPVRIKSISALNAVDVQEVVKEKKRSPHSREDILKLLHGSSGTKKKRKKVVSTATIKKTTGMKTKKQTTPTKKVITKAATTTEVIHPTIVSWIQPNNLSIWDSCLVHELCKRKRIDPLGVPRVRPEPKPIWIPSHPGSGEELLRPKVIDIIVNQKQAGKTFYTKKCIPFKANTITASCSQVHPIVPINPPPEERINKFFKNIIFQIRNPPYVLAAHYQEKANKYYKVTGQVIEKDWIQHRDTSYKSSFLSWVKIIDTWKSYSPQYYNISLYVPFEKLYNQYSGPKLMEQLIHVFNDAGFDDLPIIVNDYTTVQEAVEDETEEEGEDLDSEIIEDEPNIIPDTILNQQQQHGQRNRRRLQQTDSVDDEEEEDQPEQEDQQQEEEISCTQCIWYKGIHKNRLVQYYGSKDDTSIQKPFQYEYSDYQPSFTRVQRDYYFNELQTLINGKYSNDIQLKTILQEYCITIQNNLRIVG